MIVKLSFILLLSFPCLAQIQNQQQSINTEEIEKYILRLRTEIEDNAELQIIQVNQHTQAQTELLELSSRQIYSNLSAQAEIAEIILNPVNPARLEYETAIDSTNFVEEYELAGRIDPVKSSRLHHRPRSERLSEILAGRSFARLQTEIIALKNRLEKKREWEIMNIQRRRDYAIEVSLPQLEQKLKNNQTQEQTEPKQGLITAIMVSENKSSAVINGQVVHNGDEFEGVRINRIYNDIIEFEKNGIKWEQKVQQQPSEYWQ